MFDAMTRVSVKTLTLQVGRALGVSYAITDYISKEITDITDDAPSIKFKDLDALKENDPTHYTRFKKLEDDNTELFRLARRFEGIKRIYDIQSSSEQRRVVTEW